MNIPVVFGVDYTTAALEIRDQIAIPQDAMLKTLNVLRQDGGVREIIILSTCNRTEIYCVTNNIDNVIHTLCDLQNICARTIKKHSYIYSNEQCVQHLFRVASGLESMILGETEIVAQIKMALAVSEKNNCVGKTLYKIFQMALNTAKEVRTITQMNYIPVSMGRALINLIAVNFNDLELQNILFIGAGTMMQQILPSFKKLKCARKTVLNRTLEHAENVARNIQAEFLPLDQLPHIIADYSIIIAMSGGDQILLNHELFDRIDATKKVLVIDLSMPLITDLTLRQLSNVTLLTIDDIAQFVHIGLAERKLLVTQAEGIIEHKILEYQDWCKQCQLTPVIRALRDMAEDVRQDLVHDALHQLNIGKSPTNVMEELSIKLVNKLLHNPTVQLYENNLNQDLRKLVITLYDLQLN